MIITTVVKRTRQSFSHSSEFNSRHRPRARHPAARAYGRTPGRSAAAAVASDGGGGCGGGEAVFVHGDGKGRRAGWRAGDVL